ncbi:hypothetical protein GCM10027435_06760 [Haloparvum alkalitolerans]|uniref:poly-gamma-glutamate biosynthesis protein PgsC/CapC n=1 Tax=Haloparvum alkalitolerans TaxID=1042953 RepID=UPI003CF9FDF5
MIAATTILVVGVLLVALLSQFHGYRLGGVLVLPLVAVYTFREPFSPLVFAVAAGGAWATLWAVREYTLLHGRQVFLVGVVAGAVVSVLATLLLWAAFPDRISYEDAEVVGSIFPGIAAYNVMWQDPADRREDLTLSVGVFLLLLAVGTIAVYLVAARGLPTPPVLLLPTSDAVALLGVEPVGTPTPRIVPAWLSVSLLLADVAVYEGFRRRYDLRLAGIVLIPLLAMFSLRYGPTVLVYGVGAATVFWMLSLVHWTTLLYGRNLLAVALAGGLLVVLPVGVLEPAAAPGITLLFIGVFVGIGAYNLHRVAPSNRSAHIRISAGLFVVFYAVLLAVVPVPRTGLSSTFAPAYVALGAVIVGLAAVEIARLERSRPDAHAFASESVFAEGLPADADTESSPLVARREGDDS